MKNKSLIQNVIWNWIRVFTGLIFPLISFPYVSRVLGATGLGKVDYIYSIVGYFAMIAILGVPDYAIKEGAKVRDNKLKLGKFTSEIVIINIISTVVASIAYLGLLTFPSFQNYKSLILLMAAYIPFSSLGLAWVFQVFEDYKRITVQTIGIQIVSIILLFILVRDSGDFMGYAFVHVFSSIGSNILYLLSVSKKVRLFGYRNYNIKQHLKPIFLIFGMSAASMLYLNFGSTMLGYTIGVKSVGLYSVAIKITNIVSKLLTSISGVILARASYYYNNDLKNEFDMLVERTINCMLALAIPAAVGLFIISKPLVLLLSGIDFVDSVIAMRILCINIVLSPINGLLAYQILLPANREKYSALATVIGAIVSLSLNFVIIPRFAHSGAAFTFIVAEISVFIVCVIAGRDILHKIRVKKNIIQFVVASVPILVVGTSVYGFTSSIVLQVVLITTLGAIAYLSTLFLMKNEIVTYFFKLFIYKFKKIE